MSYTLQNFYKSTLSLDWSIGTGNFYVSTKPTSTTGWLVISPNNSSIREIIKYTSIGTDINGDYVTVSVRGVGGTTEQIHTQGEPIRMNITAEYWDDMNDQIAAIVASGVVNANTTTMGGVEIATAAEVDAGTATGGTGASLALTPDNVNAAHNIPFVAPGTVGNVMKSDGTDWVSGTVVSPFTPQTISLFKSATTQTSMQSTSNSTGTIIAVAIYSAGTIIIYRLAKDAGGNIVKTHTATLGLGGGNSLNGISICGNYVYVARTTLGVGGVTRYDLADLANVTTMTISGTNDFGQQGSSFGDGTYLYHYSSSGTFRQYSISGTTLTSVTTVTYTSAGSATASSVCDGTNVWITDTTTGAINIRKYPLAGGVATSTYTMILTVDGFPNGIGIGLFIGGTTITGVSWVHTLETNSAVVSTALQTMGITV